MPLESSDVRLKVTIKSFVPVLTPPLKEYTTVVLSVAFLLL